MGKLFGVMTGMALLASVGVANAGERAILTDAQLDKIAAGTAAVDAAVTRANAVVMFQLFDSGTLSVASIQATFVANGAAPNILTLAASGSVP